MLGDDITLASLANAVHQLEALRFEACRRYPRDFPHDHNYTTTPRAHRTAVVQRGFCASLAQKPRARDLAAASAFACARSSE